MAVFYPKAGSFWLAGEVQTLLANSVMSLFQSSLTPTVNTTKAELEAAEATYTGYAAETLAAWGDPYTSPAGGASVASPLVQFQTAAPYTTGNNIGGAWIETATGDLVAIITFPDEVPMAALGDAIPISQVLTFLSGE